VNDPRNVRIPSALKPADGRFGSGPSKVPADAVRRMALEAPFGTSHRQPRVKSLIGRIRDGLGTLFDLPDGYEILLGNGGSTAFWDAAAFGLISHRAQHVVCGEFSAKFAAVSTGAPFLDDPDVRKVDSGEGRVPGLNEGVDVYAWPQNETSTGVTLPVARVAGAADALMLVDATSAAGAIETDLAQTDVYYFAPQKVFAAEGGLWLAAFSPAAIERIDSVASTRWIPPSLDLRIARDNSAKDQTYNTPAIGSLWLLADRVEWLVAEGGVAWAAQRCEQSSSHLYRWAEKSDYTDPYVSDPAWRSPVVGTINLAESIDAAAVAMALRANGIVDTEPYRGLGRNQLRIGMYPAVDPSDVEALTHCVDFVVEQLTS
jgi:phosphoserine aminotransferase